MHSRRCFSHTLKKLKKELSEKRDYKDAIEESVQVNVVNEVKNFMSKFLPKVVKEALKKTPHSLGQSSSQELYDALTWPIKLDEITLKEDQRYEKVLKKRDREDDRDEDPSAGSN
ncbi:hypothetical protein Tco_1009113 [Tanacetum coccineum]